MFYIYQALLLLGSHCLFPKRLRNIPFPKRKGKKYKDQKYTEKWVINNCSQIWPWTLSKCRLGKLPIHVPYRKSCTLSQLIAGFCPGEVGIWEPQKKKKQSFLWSQLCTLHTVFLCIFQMIETKFQLLLNLNFKERELSPSLVFADKNNIAFNRKDLQ